MEINLPAHFSLFDKIGKDYVYQMGFEQTTVNGTIEEYSFNRVQGFVIKIDNGREILISPKRDWSAHDRFEQILFAKNLEDVETGNLKK